jgi:hypothetical protein
MDVFAVDGFLDDFPDAEAGVAGGVEALGLDVQSALLLPPLLDFGQLRGRMRTVAFLSCSETLTMWPKVGITLMLMLLREGRPTRPR